MKKSPSQEMISSLLKSIEKPKKVSKKPRYKKPPEVKQLEQDYFEWFYREKQNIPGHARVFNKFRDDTANALTKCIIAYIRTLGGFASRINTTGMYRADIKKFVRTTQRKGLADVRGLINGKSVDIEVKIGKDRMSPEQKQVKSEVEQAGGIYIIARNFAQFKKELDDKLCV
jgi:hypothetical protein